MAARRPAGIILSGGPKSVNVPGAPLLDPAIYELGVPVLGICYGAQLIARQLGGEVDNTGRGEYGRTALTLTSHGPAPSVLFGSVPPEFDVWMSHFDAIVAPPPGFRATASTADVPVAALEDPGRRHLRRAVPSRGRRTPTAARPS